MISPNKNRIFTNVLAALIGIMSLTLFSHCEKNCQDCDPVTHYAFGIRNTTNDEVTFAFYRNQDSTVLNLTPAEVLETILVEWIGKTGPLPTTPLNVLNVTARSPYDSVAVRTETSNIIYQAENCSARNPLCVESYEQSESISSDRLITTKKYIYNYE